MSRVARSGLLLLFAAVAFLASCRREAPSNIDRNQAPETYIRRAPAESTLTYYRAHFYWSGSDADGQIAYYEIAVTDSNESPGDHVEEGTGYTRTLATDSVFVLAAGRPIEQQISGKRLYVRAIDNEGKLDPTPALAFFQAKNDFFPEVFFRPGFGTWVDKCGNNLSTVLTSTDRFAPTDTIGIGGTATWSWYGRDRDASGSITGFVYKLSSQPTYRGGTLADTTATFTFPRNASRRQVLEVRAIDDGGLRSSTDYTASVVVNFDPITLSVYPPSVETNPDGTPRVGRVYLVDTRVLESGVVLPDKTDAPYQIDVFYAGYDDPRDFQETCENQGLKTFQQRRLYREDTGLNAGGEPYMDVGAPNGPYPNVNTRTIGSIGSGDTFILTRAVDLLSVFDSTPETLLVSVNYRPYVVEFKARPESAPASADVDLLALEPGVEPVFHLASTVTAEGDTIVERLLVTLLGSDYHKVSPDPNGDEFERWAFQFDPNPVIGDEPNVRIHPTEGYRAFAEETEAGSPGFNPDPTPNGPGIPVPYQVRLELRAARTYTLHGDVRDRTITNVSGNGRTNGVTRRVQIQIDN